MRFDSTGKVTLDHIYNQDDPRPYFTTLRKLDYQIPQLAKPYFQGLIGAHRKVRSVDRPQVVDIGSSYGVNAALLRCDATMDELYRRYAEAGSRSRHQLLSADREWVHSSGGAPARYLGLDISAAALDYGFGAGFLDDAVHADLERRELTAHERTQLRDTDMVISTGCLGYVGASTLARVVEACDRLPWMAHFVLRMFPFDPIAERLSEFGYQTVRLDGLFRQRRFASDDEQAQVLDTISGHGVDPHGVETDGWLYAQPYLSLPASDDVGELIHLLDVSEPVRRASSQAEHPMRQSTQ